MTNKNKNAVFASHKVQKQHFSDIHLAQNLSNRIVVSRHNLSTVFSGDIHLEDFVVVFGLFSRRILECHLSHLISIEWNDDAVGTVGVELIVRGADVEMADFIGDEREVPHRVIVAHPYMNVLLSHCLGGQKEQHGC